MKEKLTTMRATLAMPPGTFVAVVEDDGLVSFTSTRTYPWHAADACNENAVMLKDRWGYYLLSRVSVLPVNVVVIPTCVDVAVVTVSEEKEGRDDSTH